MHVAEETAHCVRSCRTDRANCFSRSLSNYRSFVLGESLLVGMQGSVQAFGGRGQDEDLSVHGQAVLPGAGDTRGERSKHVCAV
ncbi:hypothetical protein GCM10009744_43900 [Kribbella alba]|uniref:Apple domain-containing protein n=1 Tax=Kribbella alba TaxID=190197 RepID=A0ABN2FI89_9ACTN